MTRPRATVEATRSIEVEARLERLSDVRTFVRSAVGGLGGSEDAIVDLVQAVDEAATNIVSHGYRGRSGPIEVEVGTVPDGVEIRIRDRAPRFDPASAREPDPTKTRIRPGGMGIHLIRAATDSVRHADRPGGGNVLTLVRTLGRRDKEA